MNQPPAGGFGGKDGTAFGPVIAPSPHQPSTAYAVATMVVGILAIIGIWLCFISIPLGIGAIAMGAYAIRRCDRYPDLYSGRRFAIAGLVCGAVALTLTVATVVFFLFFSNYFGSWGG